MSAWVHGAFVALFLVSVPLLVQKWLKDALTVLFSLILVLSLLGGRVKDTVPLKLLYSYVLLLSLMWLIDLAHSGNIYSASIFAYRRLGYFLVAFSILLCPKVNSIHIGYPLLIFSVLHWIFGPKEVDQFGRVFSVGILASRLTAGVLAAWGALLILQEAAKKRNVWDHVLGIIAVWIAAWLAVIMGSKTAILMLLIGLCVYILYRPSTTNVLVKCLILLMIILAIIVIDSELIYKLIYYLVNELTLYETRLTSLGQRMVEWIIGVKEIGQWPTPLIGRGWEMLPEIVKEGVLKTYIGIPIQSIDHTFQSVLIDTLVAYGLPVGGAYLGFIGRLWLLAFRRGTGSILLTAILPLITVNSFSFGNGYEPVFWVGLMLALKSKDKGER